MMWASLFGRMHILLLLPMVNGCRLMRCEVNALLLTRAGDAENAIIGRVT